VLKKKSSGGLKAFITKKIEIKGAKRNKARVMKMLKHPPQNFKWDTIKKNCMLIQEKDQYLSDDKG